jgi:hypothetical protein
LLGVSLIYSSAPDFINYRFIWRCGPMLGKLWLIL